MKSLYTGMVLLSVAILCVSYSYSMDKESSYLNCGKNAQFAALLKQGTLGFSHEAIAIIALTALAKERVLNAIQPILFSDLYPEPKPDNDFIADEKARLKKIREGKSPEPHDVGQQSLALSSQLPYSAYPSLLSSSLPIQSSIIRSDSVVQAASAAASVAAAVVGASSERARPEVVSTVQAARAEIARKKDEAKESSRGFFTGLIDGLDRLMNGSEREQEDDGLGVVESS